MEKARIFFMVLAIAGLGIGLLAGSQFQEPVESGENGYCSSIEEEIRQNESITGAVSCSEPGSFEQENVSQVGNLSELACICQYSVNGREEVLAIRKTQ